MVAYQFIELYFGRNVCVRSWYEMANDVPLQSECVLKLDRYRIKGQIHPLNLSWIIYDWIKAIHSFIHSVSPFIHSYIRIKQVVKSKRFTEMRFKCVFTNGKFAEVKTVIHPNFYQIKSPNCDHDFDQLFALCSSVQKVPHLLVWQWK